MFVIKSTVYAKSISVTFYFKKYLFIFNSASALSSYNIRNSVKFEDRKNF